MHRFVKVLISSCKVNVLFNTENLNSIFENYVNNQCASKDLVPCKPLRSGNVLSVVLLLVNVLGYWCKALHSEQLKGTTVFKQMLTKV